MDNNLSPHENILTIALINIHYLYNNALFFAYVGDILANVHVQNPVFDYVPPDLVNLFISNM